MTARVSALQVAIATAIACNGCIKIEKFRGATDDAGSDPDADGGGSGSDGSMASPIVTVTQQAGKYIVGVQGLYSMEFSSTGYHFPDVLTVGGNNVLAPTSATCNNEIGAGVTYYPGGVFNGADNTFLEHVTSDIKPVLSGPAVVKMQLEWAADFDATNCAGTRPRGRSTFTFFPNGRIQRMDAAFVNQEALIASCSCVSSDHWELVTYYTFAEQYVTTFDGIANNLPRPATGASVNLEPTVCWNGPGGTNIAMAWRAQVARRMRRITSSSLALIADMIPYMMDNALTPPSPATDPLGDTSTTMWIAKGSTCGTVEPLVAPYAEDKQIEVTAYGVATPFGLGQDGLYGGEQSQNPNNEGIYPQSSPILITPRAGDGDIPPFGVWLQLDNQPNIVSVSHPHTKQAFLDSEGLENGQYLFYFPDGLSAGETITIVAAP